jgi:hypothetical protein
MGLFSPWFLAGALAVGLPIWLHLLKRSQTDPKPFPSLMFWEHRETTSVNRRLDYLILFALRTLMLLLLALLFAQPFIRRPNAAVRASDRLVVIAVDNSFSMRTGEALSTRLDQAKTEALSVIGSLPGNSKAQVVALGGTLQAMTQQVQDPGALRVAVDAIQPSDSHASFGSLARYLRTLRESADVPLTVHLISDLQKSGLPPGFLDLRLEPDTELKLHPIGSEQPNWTLETVVAPPHIYDPKQVHIVATVAGFHAPAATRTVTLMLNGKTVGSKSVEVPEGGRGTVEFVGLEASYGFNKAEARIDSADKLPQDDRFAFAVERTDPRKVLYVDEGRRLDAQRFFRAALESAQESEFQLDVSSPASAANADLSKYAMVVLSDLSQMPSSFEQSLTKYVEGGGGLFEILGAGSVSLPRAPVLDEPIEASHLAARSGERFFVVGEADGNHPALRSVERFEGVNFYQTTLLKPQKSQILAKLGDGTPLVLERKVGQGNVLAFASNFDGIANDLPRKPVFVGFIQQSVRYLAGGGAEQPVNLPVDSYVELRTGEQKGVSAEVVGPDGERLLSLKDSATAANFALTKEGFFEVKNAAGRRTLVAAHADRKESDLSVMPQETQDLWTATGGSDQPSDATTAGAGDGGTTPWSLAPIILVLLLLIAMAESILANRYLRIAPPGAKPQETMTKA